MGTIFAFGNPVYDEIITPVVRTVGRVLSGCSTNACLALARLGRDTALVGRVGEDYVPQFAAELRRNAIRNYAHVGDATGGFKLVYDQRGDRSLEILGMAPGIEHVPDACAAAEAIIVGPIMQETSAELIERIRAVSAAPLFLDPQGLLRRRDGDNVEHIVPANFAQIARHCEVIKANELETFVLTGISPREDPAAAARALRSYGCRIAIVTLAEAGSHLDDGAQSLSIPAYRTDARDPTGAGDTYLAGFLHAYLEDRHNLFGAGCLGAATASIWIEHTGPDAPIQLDEVLRRTACLLQR